MIIPLNGGRREPHQQEMKFACVLWFARSVR